MEKEIRKLSVMTTDVEPGPIEDVSDHCRGVGLVTFESPLQTKLLYDSMKQESNSSRGKPVAALVFMQFESGSVPGHSTKNR